MRHGGEVSGGSRCWVAGDNWRKESATGAMSYICYVKLIQQWWTHGRRDKVVVTPPSASGGGEQRGQPEVKNFHFSASASSLFSGT